MTGRAHKRTIVLASINLKMWRFQNNIDKTDTKLSQIGKCKWCLLAFSWTLASQLCTLSSVRLRIISLQLVKRQTKYTILYVYVVTCWYLDNSDILLLIVSLAPPPFGGWNGGKKCVSAASSHSSSVGSSRSRHISDRTFSICCMFWQKANNFETFS